MISEEIFFGVDKPCDYQFGLTGTFAFMVGLAIGLPSLYDFENEKSSIGVFGLMDQGSNNGRGLIPAPPNPFTRIWAGWENPKEINPSKASRIVRAGDIENGDTIYLTVADKDGNMVSLIQSNYRGMGSGVIPNKLGFMLQDRGEMFSLDRNHRNSLLGGKRPFHTIIPAFITKDGNPFVSFGLMGGAMQPQGHAQIVINLVDFDMNLQEAGDAPRIRHMGSSEPKLSLIHI